MFLLPIVLPIINSIVMKLVDKKINQVESDVPVSPESREAVNAVKHSIVALFIENQIIKYIPSVPEEVREAINTLIDAVIKWRVGGMK
jgi:hypothetical protein